MNNKNNANTNKIAKYSHSSLLWTIEESQWTKKKNQEQWKPEEKIKLIMIVPVTQVEEVVRNPPVVSPTNIMTIYGDANLFFNKSIYADTLMVYQTKLPKLGKPNYLKLQLRRGWVLPKSEIPPNITNNLDDIRTINDRKISLAPAVSSPLIIVIW